MKRHVVGVYVDPRVDREIEHLSVDSGQTKSGLYELGARILIALARHGTAPDVLAAILQERDEQALEKLLDLLAAKTEARG